MLVLIERLIICVSAGDISATASLTVLVSIKSIPVAVEFFNPLIVSETFWTVTLLILNVQVLSLIASFIFRQHAASIYGFVRQLVSFVSFRQSKKNLKCNISLTGAQIFMKFETYVYKIVLDHQPNFHKDPCKDARARGVNARTHVKKNLCVRSLG